MHITLKYKDGTLATDLDYDYILVTIANEGTVIEKTIPKSEVEEAQFDILFTQEETGSLVVGSHYEVELNIMWGEIRIGTSIQRFKVERNLHNEVILT